MAMLTDADYSSISNLLGHYDEIHDTSVAKLYTASGSSWEYSGVSGPISLITSGNSFFLRVVDLNAQQVTFEQELYSAFEYTQALPFFHQFESNDTVIGLSFTAEDEAYRFFENVVWAATEMGGGAGSAGGAQPNLPSRSATPSLPQRADTPPPSHPQLPAGVNLPPTEKVPATSSKPPMSLIPIQRDPSCDAPAKQKKKSKFGRLFKSKKSQPLMEISGPTDFKHDSHIGWDPSAGFEIRNIPPDWKKLFQAAGVKKSELENPETAQFLMETVTETLAKSGIEAPPMPQMGGGPPPPPPPTATGGPPPPPPPTTTGGPPAPPQPSLSSGGGGGGGGGSALSLADQIKQGKQLNKVDHDAPRASLPPLAPDQSSNLVNTLAQAMNQRRGAFAREDYSDEDDGWSEEEDEDDDDW